ncbi:hypothetical protein BDW42DRAFT_8464 [Aspergillus taichungensis]|uniref:Uncharacterized protein n=1 Tax=Aspergillus taichungensis TaxID=482145 RepID=A0A2J5HJ66_9EURO|nr:hypothetical protein BDW42DRAFT_8464 [Aspergillus taichungensis]
MKGAPPVVAEPNAERQPPTAPTPLDFPAHRPSYNPDPDAELHVKDIYQALASIRRPQDITPERFKPFNVSVEPDVPTADITGRVVSQPPLPWTPEAADPASRCLPDGSPILLDNGNPYPPKDRYDVLEKELLYDNDDAFREVSRLEPREGRERVRVTQTRKFWIGLEHMSHYWDTSLDEYFERPATPKDEVADPMQTEPDAPAPQTAMEVDSTPAATANNNSNGEKAPKIVKKYKGRRTGAGHEMPEEIRDETVRALTEMAAWPFGCQVALPMMPPRLATRALLFPVRQTFGAARSPKDRQLARSGVMEGPVFTAQCRPDTAFRGPQEELGTGTAEVCDLFREIGGMLLAAQERGREGLTEVRPGEGQWWTTVPRWGGAPNDAVGDSAKAQCNSSSNSSGSSSSEESKTPELGNARKRSKFEHPFVATGRSRTARKLSNAERWKVVQPGPSLWDRRMRYIQIGKDPASPFDDIYMLSSINHHVAILHLRVHRRYLEILTSGESNFPPESDTPDQPWYALKLRRTKWHDLFNAQERVEALHGIWTIFHQLLRRTS